MDFTSFPPITSPLLQSTSPNIPLHNLLTTFPAELVICILTHWISDPLLTLTSPNDASLIRPRFTAPIDASLLPPTYRAELKRLVRQKWLRGEKEFEDVFSFWALHTAILKEKGAFRLAWAEEEDCEEGALSLPHAFRPHPSVPLHGLETIRLSFTALEYFSFFGVSVPPFNASTDSQHDYMHGAADLLSSTKHLTLDFGSAYTSAHPWYELPSPSPWTMPQDDDVSGMALPPRCRPNVCVAGIVVDWILTYAWHNNYLRHIPHIELSGAVQPWVREKWDAVFSGTYEDIESVADERRIWDVEHVGLSEALAEGREWDDRECYPPRCACEVGCERVWRGSAVRDGEGVWDEGSDGIVIGDWFQGEEVEGVW